MGGNLGNDQNKGCFFLEGLLKLVEELSNRHFIDIACYRTADKKAYHEETHEKQMENISKEIQEEKTDGTRWNKV